MSFVFAGSTKSQFNTVVPNAMPADTDSTHGCQVAIYDAHIGFTHCHDIQCVLPDRHRGCYSYKHHIKEHLKLHIPKLQQARRTVC